MKLRTAAPVVALLLALACVDSSSDGNLFDGSTQEGWVVGGTGSLALAPDESGNTALRITGSAADSISLKVGDATGSVGVRFRMKSTVPIVFSVTTPALSASSGCTVDCGNFHRTDLAATPAWSVITLSWSQLAQASTATPVVLDGDTITYLNWLLGAAGPYELWLDDVELVYPDEPIGGTGGSVTATGGAPAGTGGTTTATGGGAATGGSTNTSTNNLGKYVTVSMFNQAFPSRNSAYVYSKLLEAVEIFPDFAACCSETAAKREIAAFLAQVEHETGGLRYTDEIGQPPNYCNPSSTDQNGVTIGCPANGNYWGRGAMQTSWNYNYYFAQQYFSQHNHGEFNLHSNPGLVTSDPVLIWATGLWFWMAGDPSYSASDTPHARIQSQGFGATTQKINGALECGASPSNPTGSTQRQEYFLKWCERLGVDPGTNLGC